MYCGVSGMQTTEFSHFLKIQLNADDCTQVHDSFLVQVTKSAHHLPRPNCAKKCSLRQSLADLHISTSYVPLLNMTPLRCLICMPVSLNPLLCFFCSRSILWVSDFLCYSLRPVAGL